MSNIDELIEWLRGCAGTPHTVQMCSDAAVALEKLQAELEQVKRELEAATADLEEIMFKGGHNIDTCHFCTNSQCYGRGGTQTCNPKWRGQKED